jgi:hypothetical protein
MGHDVPRLCISILYAALLTLLSTAPLLDADQAPGADASLSD